MAKDMKELEKTILDWHTIWGCISKYWWIIIITTALVMAGISMIPKMEKETIIGEESEPVYCGSALIYVGMQEGNSGVANSLVLLNNRIITEQVDEELKNNGMPVLQDEDLISYKEIEGTDFLSIEIEGSSKERVLYITTLLTDIYMEAAVELLGLEGCVTVNPPKVKEISKNETMQEQDRNFVVKDNKLLALAFGILSGVGILVAIMVFNDRIWCVQELQRYFGDKYFGHFAGKDGKRQNILKYQCKKHNTNQIYIAYNPDGKKGKRIFEEITQLKGDIQVDYLPESEYEKDLKGMQVFVIIEKGRDTYRAINKMLLNLKRLDAEIIGCISI